MLFHLVSHMTHQRSTPNFRPLKVDASRPWWQGCVEHRYLSASWHHPNGILWDPNVLRVLRVQKHQTSFCTRCIPMDANIPPEMNPRKKFCLFREFLPAAIELLDLLYDLLKPNATVATDMYHTDVHWKVESTEPGDLGSWCGASYGLEDIPFRTKKISSKYTKYESWQLTTLYVDRMKRWNMAPIPCSCYQYLLNIQWFFTTCSNNNCTCTTWYYIHDLGGLPSISFCHLCLEPLPVHHLSSFQAFPTLSGRATL